MGQNVDLRVLRAEEFAPFRQRNIARYAQELLFARATDTEECEGYLFPDTYEFFTDDSVYNYVNTFYKVSYCP